MCQLALKSFNFHFSWNPYTFGTSQNLDWNCSLKYVVKIRQAHMSYIGNHVSVTQIQLTRWTSWRNLVVSSREILLFFFSELWWYQRGCIVFFVHFTRRRSFSNEEYVCHNHHSDCAFHGFLSGKDLSIYDSISRHFSRTWKTRKCDVQGCR